MSKLKTKNIPFDKLECLKDQIKTYIGNDLTKDKVKGLFPDGKLRDKYVCSFRNLYESEPEITILSIISFHFRLKKLRPILEIRPGLKLVILDNWNHKLIRKNLKMEIKNYEEKVH